MSGEITVGDRLEDPEGNVWTVADVFPDAPAGFPPVRLERVQTVTTWATHDEIGPRGRRYRPLPSQEERAMRGDYDG